MQRRTATTARKGTSSSSAAAVIAEDDGYNIVDFGGVRRGDKSRRRAGATTTTPTSPFVGILIIITFGVVFVSISRLLSPSGSSIGSAGGSGGDGNNLGVQREAAKDPSLKGSVIYANDAVESTTSATTNATLHIIFSTDCGTFQHWQSYLFFHAALKVKQPGYITRIASGCTDEQLQKEQAWHDEHIRSKMSDRFRVHFTPHFSGVKDEATGEVKGDYKFFNKPFGLKHFLENNDLLGFDDGPSDGTRRMKHPDDVIILTDPDFLLLRPLTDDFSDERETVIGPRRKEIYRNMKSHVVTHGSPYAQTYGLGTQWRKFDLDAIAGADSPAKLVDQQTRAQYYPVGPPYVGTVRDMYDIAVTWSEFAPRVHSQYPHLLAEMYAYCIAAAHLKLPHMLIDSMMVSANGVGGEGWPLVKAIPAEEVCSFASEPDHSKYPVPSVVHYCQSYTVDKYFWGKRKIPHSIFTCDHPLLVEPPNDLGSGKYLKALPKGKPNGKGKELSPEKEKLEAFMVCSLTRATNDAMLYFKDHHCSDEDGGNRAKAYDMWAGKEVVAS